MAAAIRFAERLAGWSNGHQSQAVVRAAPFTKYFYFTIYKSRFLIYIVTG